MAIGDFRHVVTFQKVESVPDGGGGFVDTWVDLLPVWPVDIRPATVRDLERTGAGTVIATATHVVHARYRADVNVKCRFLFEGRIFQITGIGRLLEMPVDLYLFAKETI